MNSRDSIPAPQYINQSIGLYGFKLGNVYLTGMPIPGDDFLWENLKDLGIHFILCLTHQQAPYDPSPLTLLNAEKLDDQNQGAGPENPREEEALIRQLTAQVVEKLKNDESVVIHCVGGTGRTGTLMAAAMRELGYETEEVLQAMEKANQLRNRREKGWPESDWQLQLIRNW